MRVRRGGREEKRESKDGIEGLGEGEKEREETNRRGSERGRERE